MKFFHVGLVSEVWLQEKGMKGWNIKKGGVLYSKPKAKISSVWN